MARSQEPIWFPSPNFGPRRGGQNPSLVVLHYTAMQSAQAALERLCDPVAEVSAHYLIGRDGQVWQLVQEDQRAWHAGAGEWQGEGDVNSRSIGIELDNGGDHPFSEPQMTTLESLLKQVMQRWDMPPEAVIGHSDMAPGRKIDPGPRFDWQRLTLQGLAGPCYLSRAVKIALENPSTLRHFAQALGFTGTVDGASLRDAISLRYRPWWHKDA